MYKIASLGVLATLACGAANATECATPEEAVAHFQAVQAGYIKKAPKMSPDDFTLWASYLDEFNEWVGRGDLNSACEVLDDAAEDLELEVDGPPEGGTG